MVVAEWMWDAPPQPTVLVHFVARVLFIVVVVVFSRMEKLLMKLHGTCHGSCRAACGPSNRKTFVCFRGTRACADVCALLFVVVVRQWRT